MEPVTESLPPCPVPEDQQPLREYQALRESWFFRWALAPFPHLLPPLLGIWVGSWAIAAPVAAASFAPSRHLGLFLVTSALGASIPSFLVLAQLYLGWRYVGDRLLRPAVSYEESGWFDGQIWQKPGAILSRDRLIFTYEIRPLLRRMEQLFALGGVFLLGAALSWPFLP